MLDLHALLHRYEQARQAERPADSAGLTASATSRVCERQTAYKLQDAPITNPRDPVGANTVGSLLHDAIERLWHDEDPNAVTERRGPHGQPDVIRPTAFEVRDLKTVNRYQYDSWANAEGPPESVWAQVAIYAYDVGADEHWRLVVDVLCRDTGRTATYSRDYSDEAGSTAVAVLEGTSVWLSMHPPEAVEPNGLSGPDWVCERCPWLDACLTLREVSPYPYTDETLEAAAAKLTEARALRKQADADEKAAKAVLRGFNGRVGEWQVKWTTRNYGASVREPYTASFVDVRRVEG